MLPGNGGARDEQTSHTFLLMTVLFYQRTAGHEYERARSETQSFRCHSAFHSDFRRGKTSSNSQWATMGHSGVQRERGGQPEQAHQMGGVHIWTALRLTHCGFCFYCLEPGLAIAFDLAKKVTDDTHGQHMFCLVFGTMSRVITRIRLEISFTLMSCFVELPCSSDVCPDSWSRNV